VASIGPLNEFPILGHQHDAEWTGVEGPCLETVLGQALSKLVYADTKHVLVQVDAFVKGKLEEGHFRLIVEVMNEVRMVVLGPISDHANRSAPVI